MRYVFFLLPFFTSCSVIMASKVDGVPFEALQAAANREQLLDLGAERLESSPSEGEIYRIPQERGSIGRAFMNGLFDLPTLFLWELIATPIESALSEKKYFTVKVTFDAQDAIEKMELK